MRRTTILCLVVFSGWVSSASPQRTEPKRQVASTVEGALQLLERKQYAEFIKTYIRPSELEALLAKYETVEKIAAEYTRRERHVTMLRVLQAAAKAEPTFSREETIATYRFEPPIGKDRSLSLQKIDDRWYLRD